MTDRYALDDWLGRSDEVVKESVTLADALRGTPARHTYSSHGVVIEYPWVGNAPPVDYPNPGEDALPWCEDCEIGAIHSLEDCAGAT